ncbi:MAG TPA: glycoside hydrolase family 38 C-terminal domain-containing protein [Acidobacteriaceae bacterium]|nr:glycoside hydrolase family 38 C-terminal domain-containing protein [Acidobacteriaceae bacterium]
MTVRGRVQTAFWLIVFLVLPCTLKSQNRQSPEQPPLSQESQATLARLATFSTLPAVTWRYHLGDLPHGEDPALNDDDWQPVANPSTLPADAMWFRASIEVPKALNGYDLTGAEISFLFRVNANGPVPQIIYLNGRRVALGTDLEPITLFDHAHPGEKVLVAVKLLHTEDQKRFRGSEEPIEFPANRPNPADLRAEALSAGFLLPAVQSDPAASIQKLESAIHTVNLQALDSGNQAAFDDSLRQAHSQLMELRPVLQQANIHLTGNAHIDAAWLWPWTETVEVVRQTFGTALQLMNEYPKYTYSASAAAYYDWIEQKYPSEFDQIRQRVKEGRWEPVGGMWVEPDLNMPDGESQVRQLLIGKRYFQQRFGSDVRIGWNPDSFGYNWQLPQIYKRSGVDYFVTQKMAWNDTNQLPLKLFWWQAPDGSRVLTYFPHDYVNPIEPIKMASDFARSAVLNPGAREMMHLYGIGDHGGGPTRAMLDAGDRWISPEKAYANLNFGVAAGFFSDIENKLDTAHSPVWNYETLAAGNTNLPQPLAGEMSLPVWNDELYFEYHHGVFTSQAQHKRSMRRAEEQMLDAEKWSSIAWLSGTPYPGNDLNEAWKKVLFNQFHDLAAGSGIRPIYQDAQKDYQMVRFTANSAASRAFDAIASYIDTQGPEKEIPILVFNPLAWPRTDLVNFTVQMPAETANIEIVDHNGKILDSQASPANPATHTFHVQVLIPEIPSLGYEVVYARPAAGQRSAPTELKTSSSGMSLENQFLRVTVDPQTGCITSLVNKQTNFNAIAGGGCGNLLEAFKDTPKQYDAWNIDADFDKVVTDLKSADSVQLVEHNSLRGVIRVTRHWQNSKFVQDITLYNGLPRVDVVNDIDWHERHILLKAAFPLAASGPRATFEIPYGSIERPTTRNNSVEAAKFEVPALRWADLGDQRNGFSLINESKYGYDAKGNLLRLSLLRSPTWPDPEADQGHHHFAYALYPHAGDWKQALTVRQGYDFNYHLTAMQIPRHSGSLPVQLSFLKAGAENVVVTAMKKTEDGDGLLVRFYEWAGKPANVTLNLPKGIVSATLANLMEKPEGAPLQVSGGQEVTVPVTPYEIQTVIVHYPAPSQNFLASTAQK